MTNLTVYAKAQCGFNPKRYPDAALWRVYLYGQSEGHQLGYVIASSKDLYWIKRSYDICCDIVKYL